MKILSRIIIALAFAISRLPFRVLYWIADCMYVILYYIVRYRKKVVFDNLRLAFPEKSEKEITHIAKGFFRHFSDFVMESLKTLTISDAELNKRFKAKNIDFVNQYYEKKRSVLVVSGHYGNWDWMSVVGQHTPFVALAVYLAPKHKEFEELMIKVRNRFGAEVHEGRRLLWAILKHYRAKNPTATFILADQSPHSGRIEYWTDFMGQKTPVQLSVEQIAKKTNHVVVFFEVEKVKRGYYEITFSLVTDTPQQTAEYEITNRHTQMLEAVIRKRPELWLWSHRRWKHKFEDFANKD